MDSMTFLARLDKATIQPLYVVHGDEDFLKRQVLQALRKLILGEQADEFSLSVYAGEKVDYATVMDDLLTVPFFGPRRLVIVEGADTFITNHRAALEKAVGQLPSSGVLVLEVKTWLANTRLAKMIDDKSTIGCKAPPTARLTGWCVEWAKTQHGKQLTRPAADLLVALVGQEMGLLEQELDKLAVYVGERVRIDEKDVDKMVGRSQEENIWLILDAIGEGNVQAALQILGRVLDEGQAPLALLGAIGSSLRKLAQAGRLAQQGMSVPAALQATGVVGYFIEKNKKLLRHLGRDRANRLYDWLLEINMDLRGDSLLSDRTLLERLVIRLARKQESAIKDGGKPASR